MHAVDRGDEPVGLEQIRRRLTPRWVNHYRRGGVKPTDARWRDFQPQLAARFRGICGYCEEHCKGEVDHFRPKRRFPVLVYEWTNWILACHTCNGAKLEKWPRRGYVDPCARRRAEYPEAYFDFNTPTAEIVPRASLAGPRRQKALQTIEDLGLNGFHRLKKRTQWLVAVAAAVDSTPIDDAARQFLIEFLAARNCELSSITRKLLVERGISLPTA